MVVAKTSPKSGGHWGWVRFKRGMQDSFENPAVEIPRQMGVIRLASTEEPMPEVPTEDFRKLGQAQERG
jgi:hypothetical protein